MADLNISSREQNGVTILDLAGTIALGDTSAKLHQTLRDLVASGKNELLINLADVTSIDSSGLGSLIAGYATVEKADGHVKLVNLSDRAMELMTITKLFTVFDIFDDEGAALSSFAGGQATSA